MRSNARFMLLTGISLLAAATSVMAPGEALAKKKQQDSGFFSFFDSPPPPPPKHRVYNQRRREQDGGNSGGSDSGRKKAAKTETAPSGTPVKGPLVITVSLGQQKLTVHDIDGPIAEAPISSGTPAFPTLQGVFTVLEKSVTHYSNLYDGAPMPNMQRLTYSGTAMHAGALPGYPASHGCIRLPHNFSKQLFGMTKLGTRVIVTRDPITPLEIDHPNLIAPLPPVPTETASLADEARSGVREYENVMSMVIASARAANAPVQAAAIMDSAPLDGLTGYRLRRAQEKKQTQDALAAAQTAKVEGEAASKAAVVALEQAKADARKANLEAQRLAGEVKKAEQARTDGDRALETFGKRYAEDKALRADELIKAAEAEKQLEDKTFELGSAMTSTREAALKGKTAAAAADAGVVAAAARIKEIAARLVATNKDIKTHLATLETIRRQDLARKHPVSVYISRSLGRLYVRQGYVPIFDVPVEIKEPTVALGTHVFTAIEQTSPTKMRWTAATIPYTPGPSPEPRKKRNANYDIPPTGTHLPQTPQTALDRIVIPEEARERIADVMKAGSSIVISDYGLSHQTGPFSDFIVLTR